MLRNSTKFYKHCNKLFKENKGVRFYSDWRWDQRLSYYNRLGAQPLFYKTVGDLLENAAEQYGDRTALVAAHQNQRISFAEAKEKADAFASGLLELGLNKGDRVAIWAPNSLEWYIAKLATARAGFVSVYINPAYQASEVKHCLNKVGVKLLVTAETFKTQNYFNILKEIAPEISTSKPGAIKSEAVPTLESVVFISDNKLPGSFRFQDISNIATGTQEKLKKVTEKVEAEDACNIQFTSGTTGSPKGATLSHFNIVNNSYRIGLRQELQLKHHTMCLLGPFFHAMGSVIGALTCLHHGVTLVIPDYSFNPAKAIPTILNEKCTVLLGTPTMYVDILRVMKEKNITAETPELAISGGALCTPELFKDMLKTLNVKRVSSVYGLTESGPVSFMSKPTDSFEQMTSTVGHVMDNAEVKVVDSNSRIVPYNTPGELWVRGFLTMIGYWDDEAKTKETITADGWLRTGDQFVLDKDGYGKIVGRIKDMIIRGGENIFPLDVEEFMNTHPDILEIQVFGVPDERLGEQVCACIRLKEGSQVTEEDIKKFCKGKISHFKIPHYIYFFDDFPKTASGKIQRFKLRERVLKIIKK